MNKDKKWKRFENLSAHIQRILAPNACVEQDVRMKGIISGVERQIDIAIRATIGQFKLFIVIDCKDYQQRIDVKDVEAFIGLVRDVGANKGALVSVVGFSQAARKVAEAAGLDLYTLIDVESVDWPSFIAIPVLIDDRSIDAVSYSFSSTHLHEINLTGDVRKQSIFRADGTRIGSLKDLVTRLWNEGLISHEPGEYRGIRLSDEPTFLKTMTKIARVDLSADVRVVKTLFFGQLPIVKMQGFQDEMSKDIYTKSFTTDFLDTETIEKTWRKLTAEDAVAVTPVMKLVQSSYYQLEGEE